MRSTVKRLLGSNDAGHTRISTRHRGRNNLRDGARVLHESVAS